MLRVQTSRELRSKKDNFKAMEGISSGVSRFNATFRGMQRFCRVTRRRAGGAGIFEVSPGRCVGSREKRKERKFEMRWIQVDSTG